jgi:hypothetical protein
MLDLPAVIFNTHLPQFYREPLHAALKHDHLEAIAALRTALVSEKRTFAKQLILICDG